MQNIHDRIDGIQIVSEGSNGEVASLAEFGIAKHL
jgi:hypothetical protein